ncbi:MAG: NAD-binding protein [Candidatus Parvarchaeota archaeon]|nr:NAD-binding protein [Candidatus Jingweiarchaeum tengchongense]MCW1297858.1 NAD-binding protein [Candidatus Jingweiarchaeum tengchongense]MCW1299869.1 NAD-binding protein [Candidatus Jingweiarchaeum tengchongense]MCW1304161.1 NAD-binding protein [Candidatus Jingweiarchaeum tengchongense]MCW1305189.1 NAD-binding protein [Candidatus Jingweiarchaeum tengchongense]
MNKKYIVCGAGRVGGKVANVLKQYGADVTIIERDRDVARFFKKEGYNVLLGDVLDEKTLKKANIECADWLIAVLGKDVDNLFVILKAKEMNPKIKTAARVSDESSLESFYKSGVDLLVLPELIGGLHLAKAILGIEKPIRLQTLEEIKK